ncbi:hypothetical protein [Burkholderia stagnalis]|uniref:hypothetical protein n=1 Tax=Burkholderia stagnalis TaxID=1503054 RepID=UPI000A9331FF|nr:hypothetical protein [Burkholderia stagnalis]
MSAPKKQDRDTYQQHRNFAQDNATDDGMPVTPEKSRLASPFEREWPRTPKQQISDARKRLGMEYLLSQ